MKLPWLCAALLGIIGWLIGFSTNSGPPGRPTKTSPQDASSASSAAPLGEPGISAKMKDFEKAAAAILEDDNDLRQIHRLYLLVQDFSAPEMPDVLNAALHLDGGRYRALQCLISHWVELDPRAAAQFTRTLPNQEGSSLRSAALRTWAEKDFDAASQYALALAPGKERQKALGDIVVTLAKTDPVRAVKFFEENVKVAEITEAQFSTNYLSGIVNQWASKDFDAAANYVLTIKNRETQRDVLRFLSFAKIEKSPQDLLNWAKEIPDLESRDSFYRLAFESWSRQDPQALLEYTRTNPLGELQKEAVCRALGQWAQRDTDAAVEYAKSLPADEIRDQAIRELASQVAHKDVPVSLAIAGLLPEGSQRDEAFIQIGNRWGQADPKAAATYFFENPSSPENQGLASVIGVWARSDLQEALAWADALPSGKEKEKATAIVLGQMASNDPKAAAAATLKLTGDARASAAANVAGNWVQHDPAAAMAWAETLPEGASRTNALTSLIERWPSEDWTAVEQWLGALASGDSRDSAIRAFSTRVLWKNPADAAEWASTISDESSRNNAVENVAREWMKKNKEAARIWIQSTPSISEEVRQRLLAKKDG